MRGATMQQADLRIRSLSVRLVILAVCVLLPSLILAGALISRIGLLDRGRADHEALLLARRVSSALDREIEGNVETLRALASSPALQQGNLEVFHKQATDSFKSGRMHALLRTPDGQQVLNTRVPFGSPLPSRELAEHEREALRTGKPAISQLIPGDVAKRWQLGLSIPIIHNAHLAYVLTLSVDPGDIAEIVQAIPRGPDWIIAVSDASGRLMARSIEQSTYLGRIIHPDVKSWSHPPEGAQRTAFMGTGEVLHGYRWSEKTGWMTAAFVPSQVIDGPLRDLWWRFGWSALAVTLLTLPSIYWLGRGIAAPVEQAASDARRLGRGELVEPRMSSLLEANQLSAALATASRELQDRTREISNNEIRYRGIFEQAAVGFGQIGLDGRMIGVNNRLCQMLGYTREECLERTFKVLSHPEDWNAEDELITALLEGEKQHYEIEKRVLMKSGDVLWVRVTSSLVRNTDGTPLHRTSVIEDVTERRKAREAAARLAATVLASHDAMISICPSGIIETWNPAAETLFGYCANEIIGKSLAVLVPRGREHEFCKKLQTAAAGQTMKFETVRLHKNGTPIDVSSTAVAITTRGRVTAIGVTMEDIRERKRRERQVVLLNRELAHRVKNTLAVIQSIANQTMRSTPEPAAYQSAFQGRLQSLAAANDLLMQTNWEGAQLRHFVNRQLGALMPSAFRPLSIDGPDVVLPADLSIPLSLALHELGTNAIKYGAWSRNGRVDLTWSIEPSDDAYGTRLLMTWQEIGGPPVRAPTRRGFGTTIIERGIPNAKVVRQFPVSGVICTISVPLIPQPPPSLS